MAQSPVKMEVDTTHIRIGEQIEYKLSVDNTETVIFPKLEMDSLKKVEVVEDIPVDTTKTKFIKKYLLTSFDSGSYLIPQQQVLINAKKFKTDSLLIAVSTVKVDTLKQKLFPIKATKNQPIIFDDYALYVWIGLAILALIIAIVLYFVLRKKKEEIPIEERIHPYQLAMQRLGELDAKELLKQDKIKLYYIELTDIIRTYIERELKIPALESTTDELIEMILDFKSMDKLDLPKETIRNLQKLLQEADLVKFAKFKPMAIEVEGHRTQTESIINNLRPEEAEVKDNGESKIVSTPKAVQDPKKKWSKKKIIIVSVVSFLFVVLTIVGVVMYKGYKYAQENIIGYQTKELLQKEWSLSTYGSPTVTLESPEILKSNLVEVPAQAKEMINQIAQFDYTSIIGGLQISVTTMDFTDKVQEYNLESGVQGALSSMQSQGVEFISKDQEPVLISGQEGIKLIAQFSQLNPVTNMPEFFQLRGVVFGDVNGSRTIVTTYKDEDTHGEEIANRVINSIEL